MFSASSTSKSNSKLKKLTTRALCSAVLLATPLLAAQPAAAEGPKTPQEAAVCRGLLTTFFGGAAGFTQQNVGAVCAIQTDADTSD
ncbi:hypothetical protein GCM10010430_24020 [Kitasatospora cystarginea]|uniref:Secreted protein n=1 Tax=Kitasatospora cystarginea TaxID=58350 RepID=A0ABN3DTX5_9ACTN